MGGLMKIYTQEKKMISGDAGGHLFVKGAESITYEYPKLLILNDIDRITLF
jgi:hypothetical protein